MPSESWNNIRGDIANTFCEVVGIQAREALLLGRNTARNAMKTAARGGGVNGGWEVFIFNLFVFTGPWTLSPWMCLNTDVQRRT